MSYIPFSPSIFKTIIILRFPPIFTSQLYALYRPAAYIIFTALSLILNWLGLKLTIAIYRGLPIERLLPYIPYIPHIPIQSSNII